MEFYKTFIKNALIIFLIVVLFISVIMLLSKDEYPQIVNPCPDHWVYQDGSCNNIHNIGIIDQAKWNNYVGMIDCKSEGTGNSVVPGALPNFSNNWWNKHNGGRKKRWAMRCKQPWTGVWPSAYGNYKLRGDQYGPYNPFKKNKNHVTTVDTDKI